MEAIKLCLVEGCKDPAGARGLCKKHYKRWQRHGDVEYNSRPKVVAGENNNKHPLYKTWRSITRRDGEFGVETRWRSFQNFIDDIKEIPTEAEIFKKKNPQLPFGPKNYFWSSSRKSLKSQLRRSIPGPMPKAEYLEKQEHLQLKGRKLNGVSSKSFRRRERNLAKKYGITIEKYHEMLNSQGGVCKICGKPEERFQGSLAVDHCHSTGKIRGLLCGKCNTMLGQADDSVEILQAAIDYLNFHSQA